MKYFKVTNVDDTEDEFYVSSTLPNETPCHLAMTLNLGEGDGRYDIVEVDKEEFDRETEEDESDLYDHFREVQEAIPFFSRYDEEGDWYDYDGDDSDCY